MNFFLTGFFAPIGLVLLIVSVALIINFSALIVNVIINLLIHIQTIFIKLYYSIFNYKIARLPNYKIPFRLYRPLACQIEPGD